MGVCSIAINRAAVSCVPGSARVMITGKFDPAMLLIFKSGQVAARIFADFLSKRATKFC